MDPLLSNVEAHYGYLPAKLGENTKTLDFQHGSPGTIPLIALAARIFPNLRARCIYVAETAAELTWREGLLLRGNGISLGITGNAYCLLALSRLFKELSEECAS